MGAYALIPGELLSNPPGDKDSFRNAVFVAARPIHILLVDTCLATRLIVRLQ